MLPFSSELKGACFSAIKGRPRLTKKRYNVHSLGHQTNPGKEVHEEIPNLWHQPELLDENWRDDDKNKESDGHQADRRPSRIFLLVRGLGLPHTFLDASGMLLVCAPLGGCLGHFCKDNKD